MRHFSLLSPKKINYQLSCCGPEVGSPILNNLMLVLVFSKETAKVSDREIYIPVSFLYASVIQVKGDG